MDREEQLDYMRDYVRTFWDKHSKAVKREEYNLYRNYCLTIMRFGTVREIAMESGYDGDDFVFSYLPVVDHKFLNAAVNEKILESKEYQKYQAERADKDFEREVLKHKFRKHR